MLDVTTKPLDFLYDYLLLSITPCGMTFSYVVQLGDPIEERFKEEEARGPCTEQLSKCINSFREAAISKDSRYDHIDVAEKEKASAQLRTARCLYFSCKCELINDMLVDACRLLLNVTKQKNG